MSDIGSICPYLKGCGHGDCIGFDHVGCEHKPVKDKKKSVPDKPPIMVYVQEKETGIGKLYFNGKLINGLQKISIEAETDTEVVSWPRLILETTPHLLVKNFE